MQKKKATLLKQAWGDKPCAHPAFAKEYDNGERTGNFVCTACGAVECLPEIELAIRRSKAPRAVRQRQVEVHVRGLCDACI